MMDPATARLALKLQLDDVDAILQTLPKSSNDAVRNGEKSAFEALRSELVKKWNEIHGQAYAYHVLREENDNCTAFNRLLSEEQQAERDHDMACRLAGRPVPQRSAAPNERPASASGTKKLRVHFDGTQNAGSQPEASISKKRPTEDGLKPASKRARLEDADDEDDKMAAPQARLTTPNKRAAYVDPAVLREDEDGRTKRIKLSELAGFLGLDGIVTTSPATVDWSDSEKGKGKADPARHGTCSSCLDMHPKHNMLQLPCKDDNDTDTHAYCGDCLKRLFESSVTDPSHFPPRCCSKIIPLFSCTPFLPQVLVARFVARREELETLNRTYCSNAGCSKWVRPSNIVGGVATCVECARKTCATCKAKQHEGLCPEDKDVKELMSVAQQKRWQTCPNCKEMVELEQGCYHITCRCRHEFCYRCVAKWKTCQCPAWDERNIVDRPLHADNVAQPVANAAAPAPAAPPAPLILPVNQNGHVQAQAPVQAQQNQTPVANNRRGNGRGKRRNRNHNHAHVHDFERYYRSEGWETDCDMCGHEGRWVNCCVQCDVKVCWYCRKHRV